VREATDSSSCHSASWLASRSGSGCTLTGVTVQLKREE